MSEAGALQVVHVALFMISFRLAAHSSMPNVSAVASINCENVISSMEIWSLFRMVAGSTMFIKRPAIFVHNRARKLVSLSMSRLVSCVAD